MIDLATIAALEHMGSITEPLGARRTLSVWRHETARGGRTLYEIAVTDGDVIMEQRTAHLAARAHVAARALRRRWSSESIAPPCGAAGVAS